MRPLLASLVVGVALVSPVVRAEVGATTVLPTFADIKWLSSPDVAKKQVSARGYAYVGQYESGDFAYQGDVSGVSATIDLSFNVQEQLVRVLVRFNDSSRPYGIFKAMKPKLEAKYGAGNETNTLKSYMYGSEVLVGNAIKTDTGELYTMWNYKSPMLNASVGIGIGKPFESKDDVHCSVSYEHEAWEAESKRRSSKSDL